MEPETNNDTLVQELEEKSGLHKVTPLSKYLAMALFIIMPFVGGWIGYQYAPDKKVEVEKVVYEKEVYDDVVDSDENEGYVLDFVSHPAAVVKESKNKITVYVPTAEHGNIKIIDIYPKRTLVDLSEEIGIKGDSVELTEKYFSLDKEVNFYLPETITYNGTQKVDTKNGISIDYKVFQLTKYIILDNLDGTFFEIAYYPEHHVADNTSVEFIADPVEVFDVIVNSLKFEVTADGESEVNVKKDGNDNDGDLGGVSSIESCSFSKKSLASLENDSFEKTSTEYFKIWVPDSVELVADGNSQVDYFIKDKNSESFAKIHVYNLRNEVMVARGGFEAGSSRYDVPSKTWWSMPFSEKVNSVPCDVDGLPQTTEQNPIIVTAWGDMGHYAIQYSVVFESQLDKYLTSGAVQFGINGDYNDSEYDKHELFEATVEQMIQTIEPKMFKG